MTEQPDMNSTDKLTITILVAVLAAGFIWLLFLLLNRQRLVNATPNSTATIVRASTAKDEPSIMGECSNADFAGVNALYMAALRNPKYKWVEARGKKGEPGVLQVIAHTTPNPNLDGVLNGAN